MWKCGQCGESLEDEFDTCWNCTCERGKNKIPSPRTQAGQSITKPMRISPDMEETPPIGRGSEKPPSDGKNTIATLRLFGWMNLFLGASIATYLFWLSTSEIFTNSMQIIIIISGIGFAAEGIFGCAFLLVICVIAENTVAARKELESGTKSPINSINRTAKKLRFFNPGL